MKTQTQNSFIIVTLYDNVRLNDLLKEIFKADTLIKKTQKNTKCL